MQPVEAWKYQDPQKVVERMQSQTCAGCKHQADVKDIFPNDTSKLYCKLGKIHGHHCHQYED